MIFQHHLFFIPPPAVDGLSMSLTAAVGIHSAYIDFFHFHALFSVFYPKFDVRHWESEHYKMAGRHGAPRPPITDVGTETAFRLEKAQAFPKK